MLGYWVKIVAGAALVFALGMAVVSLTGKAREGIEYVQHSTGPIEIPFFMVPFEVDGQKVGTVRRLTIFRDSTRNPEHVAISIAPSDSGRLLLTSDCILTVHAAGDNFAPNRYDCLTSADTAGRDLTTFGMLRLRDLADSFPLLAPRGIVEELRDAAADDMSGQDEAARELRDSLNEVRREMIDSIRDEAVSKAAAAQEEARIKMDSLRRTMQQEN